MYSDGNLTSFDRLLRSSWTLVLERTSKKEFGAMMFKHMFEAHADIANMFSLAPEAIGSKFTEVRVLRLTCAHALIHKCMYRVVHACSVD